jgi:predicted ATPase
MRIGLCGAQRVGKTTLARAYSEKSGMPFVQTNTRQVLADLGVDAKTQYPIEKRLFIQTAILRELMFQWEQHTDAIFDRTPLDVLAYMEADLLRDSPSTQFFVDAVAHYRTLCLTATNLFTGIILVQPGIKILEEEGAAQGNPPYMEHFNTLCLGYMHPTVIRVRSIVLSRKMLDLDKRVMELNFFVNTL